MERSAKSAIPMTSQTAVSAGNFRRRMEAVAVALSAACIQSGLIDAANFSTVSPPITSRILGGARSVEGRFTARERGPTASTIVRALDGERSVDVRFMA